MNENALVKASSFRNAVLRRKQIIIGANLGLLTVSLKLAQFNQ